MAIATRLGRRRAVAQRLWRNPFRFQFSSRRLFRLIIILLAAIAILPPIFFHFRLKRFHQIQRRKCNWLKDPPLVCAHGGDSTKAFPNTMSAYQIALRSQVDCIEIDVSRSSDGILFALHDRMLDARALLGHGDEFLRNSFCRDLQQITGLNTSKVGYMSKKEIKELGSPQHLRNENIPTVEEAVTLTSSSVRQVILDAKVGPPLYERGLAKDILDIIERTQCKNCLVWAKSDTLARDIIRLSSDVTVGYIVMKDPSTGERSKLLRMRGADVVGIYHPLIDKKTVGILHGRGKKVYAWTVDDADSMQKMLFEGVDALVSSNPTLLHTVMQQLRTQCLEDGFSLSSP